MTNTPTTRRKQTRILALIALLVGILLLATGCRSTPDPDTLPDLAFGRFEIRMEGYEPGDQCAEEYGPITMTHCVRNTGNVDSGQFAIASGDTTHTVEGLAAGEEFCFTISGSQTIIDPDNQVEEQREDNNHLDHAMLPRPTQPLLCTATPSN